MKENATQDPLILALETATLIGSVALFAGDKMLGYIEYRQARTHAKLLTPMIQTLLADMDVKPQDLSAIAIAKGPGSYTGLRVGTSTAKGLCMALDKPLLSIDSLEALAGQVPELAEQLDAWVCPMIDARRMEVYCAVYDGHLQVQTDIHAKIIEEDAFQDLLAERKVIFLGDGAEKCKSILRQSPNAIVIGKSVSSAASMGKVLWRKYQAGEFEDLVTFEPFYLKDFVATKSKKKYW